jgi:subtilisin family serine protease
MSGEEVPLDIGSVVGVAPYASIVPLRVSNSVVHLSFAHLIASLNFAADHGCHIVSMSLGGPLPSRALQQALQYAVGRGLILVAAAGNVWPFVVYPGRYDETVCVAASNCDRGIWSKSATGPEVDLAAPGESVWNACLRGNEYAVSRGSGTSFATAMTAGAAALWLSYHGHGNLERRFGCENIPSLFKELLLKQGVAPVPGWEKDRVGAGLLDVSALLIAPLPETARAGGMRALRASGAAPPISSLGELERFFAPADRTGMRSGLLRLFDADEATFPRMMDRFGDELAFHVALNQDVRRSVNAASRANARRGAQAVRRSVRQDLRFQAEASQSLLRAWT